MKTFIFNAVMDGRGKVSTRIYRMKNNIPSYIGSITYSNGACKGHESEVLSFLCAAGYIPKKVMKLSKCEWRGEGYYCKEVMDAGYSIYGV